MRQLSTPVACRTFWGSLCAGVKLHYGLGILLFFWGGLCSKDIPCLNPTRSSISCPFNDLAGLQLNQDLNDNQLD